MLSGGVTTPACLAKARATAVAGLVTTNQQQRTHDHTYIQPYNAAVTVSSQCCATAWQRVERTDTTADERRSSRLAVGGCGRLWVGPRSYGGLPSVESVWSTAASSRSCSRTQAVYAIRCYY